MAEEVVPPTDLSCPEGFFKGVKYFLIGNIDEKVRMKLAKLRHISILIKFPGNLIMIKETEASLLVPCRSQVSTKVRLQIVAPTQICCVAPALDRPVIICPDQI